MSGPPIVAAILATQDRVDYIGELVEKLTPHVGKVEIFVDTERRGHTWNARRAMRMVEEADEGQPVLMLDDDMLPAPDWAARWRKIQQMSGSNIFSLFTRQRRLAKLASRGYAHGIFGRGFYLAAAILVDQRGLLQAVDDWTATEGKDHPRKAHYDVMMQEYLITHRMPWVVTVPTLFDHVSTKSTLGHSIGRSPFFHRIPLGFK